MTTTGEQEEIATERLPVPARNPRAAGGHVGTSPLLSPPQRTGVIVTVFIVVAVTFGAGVVGAVVLARYARTQSAAQGQSTSSPGPAAAPAPAPAVSRFTGDLRDPLLRPPDQTRPWGQPASVDGRLSLAQAATLYPDPIAAGEQLDRHHFVRGATVSWTDVDGTLVSVLLLQFGTAADARSELDLGGGGPADDLTEVAPMWGAPGMRIFAGAATDRDGYRYGLAAVQKYDLLEIVRAGQINASQVEVAQVAAGLAARQYARLP